ncbi:inactive rhomboid protein 1-like [Dorcoceras hygrometricum]|uniref:Inactive rhomboid protein 1-like n=1 Tax=Dorcoceras hygrometricum TaxID=472368 RepID=A0A2Z7B0K1_9LAMI|nr:inactive rhomboid protein 1-like [Dorcoceras hygrometricum]
MPRRARDQQDDDAPPPHPPPQMTPFERANVEMLAGITRILERQSERSGKPHEEDVTERFCKEGRKEFVGTTDSLAVERDSCAWCHYTRFARLSGDPLVYFECIHTEDGYCSESMGVALAVTVPLGEELTTTNACRVWR